MPWKYDQASGALTHDGEMIATGYAGKPPSKNIPADQDKPFLGPLPRGGYTIGQPVANGGHMGPYVLPLTPDPANDMFGRDGFFIHGDSITDPGDASDGCIVLNRQWRTMIAQSDDTLLVVT
jgi:hypothetical protein